MTVITRLGYCERCASEGRPKTGNLFLVNGTTCGHFKAFNATRNGKRGFVPHLYRLIKVNDCKIVYERICCMEGCGTYLVQEGRRSFLEVDDSKWSNQITTSLNNWNSLVLFKDTGLKI